MPTEKHAGFQDCGLCCCSQSQSSVAKDTEPPRAPSSLLGSLAFSVCFPIKLQTLCGVYGNKKDQGTSLVCPVI
jgi:hypothetical protein